MKNLLMLFILTFLFVHSTEASDWEVVAASKDHKYYVDKQSIEEYTISCSWIICCFYTMGEGFIKDIPKNAIRVWIKTINKNPKENEAKEELDYQEHDCLRGRSRLLHSTKYYSDGINESVNLTVVTKWDYIPPDTIMKFLHEYLCKKR